MSDEADSAGPVFDGYRCTDANEVRAFHASQCGARSVVEDPAPGQPFVFTFERMRLGPVLISAHQHSTAITGEFESEDVYTLLHGEAGSMAVQQNGVDVTATAGTVAVSNPAYGPVTVLSGAGSRSRALRIDARVLRTTLEVLLDHPVGATVRLAPRLDVSTGTGRGWMRLVDLFTEQLQDRDPEGLPALIIEPLCQAMLTGLLLSCDHPYRRQLQRPARYHPRTVKNAVEAIHAQPELAHTTPSLARLCGVSPRTLQDGFRRHLGVPPMTYLRQVRLARVHDDLRSGRVNTVAEAAYRWGFTHLGRFAAMYRHRYGITPSATHADTS